MSQDDVFQRNEVVRQIGLSSREDILNIDEAVEQLVIFSLGPEWFAFPGQTIREILPYSPITLVPGLPDYFLGIINVRGDLESVIDLQRIIYGQPSKTDLMNRILLTKKPACSTGFKVDYVHDIVDLPLSAIRPVSNIADKEKEKYFSGEFQYKSHTVLILNMQALINDLIDEPEE